eukprot:4420368-Pleurochrysis_carterae.AAC.2
MCMQISRAPPRLRPISPRRCARRSSSTTAARQERCPRLRFKLAPSRPSTNALVTSCETTKGEYGPWAAATSHICKANRSELPMSAIVRAVPARSISNFVRLRAADLQVSETRDRAGNIQRCWRTRLHPAFPLEHGAQRDQLLTCGAAWTPRSA